MRVAWIADCTHCPLIFSGKCSDCPEHQAEVAEYFESIEKHIRDVISLDDVL
jgi:hypothetical protein